MRVRGKQAEFGWRVAPPPAVIIARRLAASHPAVLGRRSASPLILYAGLVHLKGLTTPRVLSLTGTRVSRNGEKKFQSALPICLIQRSHPMNNMFSAAS
jgi:hypothetical protein